MEILSDTDDAVMQFSKHFLILGWGLREQNRVTNIRINFPQDWTLFDIYLKAMGNKIDTPDSRDLYDLECVAYNGAPKSDNFKYLMQANVGHYLEIVLRQKEIILNTWHFALPNQTPSTELMQLSFFLAVTDSVKLGML